MSENYFAKFPLVSYNGANSINLTARVKVLDKVYNNPKFYYKLEIPEFVRPDQLSDQLYRDPTLAWLFYLANDIVDPYYEWNMDSFTFDNYIVEKYGSVQSAQSRVAYWQNNWYDDPNKLTTTQYAALLDTQSKYYEPILIGKQIIEYRRRQIDWVVNTNQIWEYTTTGDAKLSIDEKITLGASSNVAIANAQVLYANSSYVRAQHIYGNSSPATSIVGANNRVTVTVTSAKQVSINIPLSEQVYWSGVSYYEVEQYKNRKVSNISALSEKYAKQAALELKRSFSS